MWKIVYVYYWPLINRISRLRIRIHPILLHIHSFGVRWGACPARDPRRTAGGMVSLGFGLGVRVSPGYIFKAGGCTCRK